MSLTRALVLIAAGTLSLATLVQLASPPTPRLIYNSSDSAAIGWYVLDPNGVLVRNAKVAAFAPQKARALGETRGYLPRHIPLIKTVWAIQGETICAKDGIISTQNRPDVHARSRDSFGRSMPQWNGCITLRDGEVFLVSTDVENSWDSRYFGPVPLENVLGTLHFLGTIRTLSSKAWESSGRARAMSEAKGADRKIKDGRPPWGLSRCLHIFFGRPAETGGGPPFSSHNPAALKRTGGPPIRCFDARVYWTAP